ncbi:TPA: lysozyme inhibitor LprI family protein, partial [Shigella flexneri]|nr:lysozyme inhibitor LprI family protein [Shigella flexneri]
MFKFLVLTLGIISCQAYAEDTVIVNDHDTSAIKDCWQKNSDDDTDINVIKSCLRQEYNLVDAQLNKAYGEAYRYIEQVPRTGAKKLDTEQLNLLKKSQRAWLDFRDKECELILSNEDVQDLSDPYSESEWLSC